ncbi:MAG: D-alanine--D-alanine ligase [Spirochaetales bacterium]|jgi:D-alanine-D-alanine ligase|nr:D-alanine--D-alanine ligase [Spirochaetales bacterium]
MKTVLVLYGGRSGEHEVSLRSAASVVSNLDSRWKILLGGITREGLWYLQGEEYCAKAREEAAPVLEILQNPETLMSVIPGRGLAAGGKLLAADVVFPVLHGSFGEDGLLQGLLENAMLAYVGAGVLGSSLSMDKDKVKRVWKEAGLPVVPSFTLEKETWLKSLKGKPEGKTLLDAVQREFGCPFFVKPSGAGSSVGITRVHKEDEAERALEAAFQFDTKILIEKAINAREIECSVLGNFTPRAFTPGEIVPSHEFYDYDAKYIDPEGARLFIPAKLEAAALDRIKAMAVEAYAAAGAEGMSRIDFFVDKDTGNIYINEINTIPGFTSISMFPRMCAHDGLSYPDLLNELLELGIERFARRSMLRYSYQCS